MKRTIAAMFLALTLASLNVAAPCAASDNFPGQQLNLSDAEKQNIERFLDHFNWQGVRIYVGTPDPLAAIWDIGIHKPELLQKNNQGQLGLAEKLVAENALRLFGYPLDKSALPEYIESKNGILWFPQGDGPTTGKSQISAAYKLASGDIAVLGQTSLSADEEKQPFLAILRPNKFNKDEGYALRSQIDLQ